MEKVSLVSKTKVEKIEQQKNFPLFLFLSITHGDECLLCLRFSYKRRLCVKKRIFRDRIGGLVIIGQVFIPIIVEIGTNFKEFAQVLRKLDLWF